MLKSKSRALDCITLMALGLVVLLAEPARAQQLPEQLGQVNVEPNGWPVPQHAKAAEVGCCVTGRGYPASAAELEGLFAYRNDVGIDWVKDAKSGPGVFSPLCGFSGQLLLRGGACKLDFGWYNVTANGAAPRDNEIYTIIPKNDPDIYGPPNNQMDFCPLAGMTTNAGEAMRCTAAATKSFNASDIRSDPNYKGGLIGFALRGDPTGVCKETHYSQNELHPKCSATMTDPSRPCRADAQDSPWTMSLIYESKAFPDSYYLAFEDAPVTRFGDGMNDNDGDFNDFVFFITGVTCQGGGELCDASLTNPALKGVCAVGRTGCAAAGGAPACKPVVEPQAERCDNLDNDCNGLVDDGSLCAAGEVCDRGTCVHACGGAEFPCQGGLVCNRAGFCVDPACAEVTCQDGQVCRGGVCSGGCGPEVVCPLGQECQLGRCVDPCQGVTCEDNQVCEKGVCISSCNCRPCGDGKACATTGPDKDRCVDAGCEAQSCAAGTRCISGSCVDTCTLGVVCPGNAACVNGVCADPLPPPPGPDKPPAGPIILPPDSSAGSASVPPPPTGSGGAGATPPPGPGAIRRDAEPGGCGCKVPSPAGTSGGHALALASLVLFGLTRRRSRARAADIL